MRAAFVRALFPLVLLSMGGAGAAFGQTAGEPRLRPRREAYAFAAAGKPDWSVALDMALWASSDDPSAAARAAVVSAAAELRSAVSPLDERERADAVLSFMHRRFLRSYSERQTRLDALVSTGSYNCVSSAALYAVLGLSVGLDVSGVSAKDHAFCAVRVGADLIDVETTNVYGFDPGSRKEFHDSFGRTTGFAYVPQRSYRDRSPIGVAELVSLILSNRAADLEAAGRFSEAVGPAADRWALLGAASDGAARDELVARAVNYGAFLAKAGREREALDWAAVAVSEYGPHPRWSEFVASAANNLLVRLLRRGDVPSVRAELDRLRPDLPEPAYRELAALVADSALVYAAERAGSAAGIAAFLADAAAARAAASVPEGRLGDIAAFAALRRAEAVARESGWAAAAAETERLIVALGADRRLQDALRAYRANRAAELHNDFAELYNAGRYVDARDAAASALLEFPGDPRLGADLDAAERALRDVSR